MRRAIGSIGVLLLALSACNVYNPSGEGSPESAQDWIDQGNAQLRALEFEDAKASFGHALAKDSGNTAAWIGYAKATSGDSLDLSLLLREAIDAQNEGRKPLWDMPWRGKDSAYRSLLPLWRVFETWSRLDSLGKAHMPDDQKTEKGMLTLAHSMLALWDFDGNGRIDSLHGDATAWLLFDTAAIKGGFKPSLELVTFNTDADGNVDTTGNVDTKKVGNFNALLDRSGSDFSAIMDLAATDTAMEAMFSAVKDQNPEAITMYKVSDSIDDDMDGCVDEEILDSLDNDGDGLIDEDSRAGFRLTTTTKQAGKDVRAIRLVPDGIRDDRLADSTGKGLPARSARQDTIWKYGDTQGHTTVFAPMWDPKDSRYGTLHWETSCKDGICQGSLKEVANRLLVNDAIRAVPPGRKRAEKGCRLLGGCWCKQLEDVYNYTPAEISSLRATR